eukprot:6205832-Pleurochrysis_carterae.AAC.2
MFHDAESIPLLIPLHRAGLWLLTERIRARFASASTGVRVRRQTWLAASRPLHRADKFARPCELICACPYIRRQAGVVCKLVTARGLNRTSHACKLVYAFSMLAVHDGPQGMQLRMYMCMT